MIVYYFVCIFVHLFNLYLYLYLYFLQLLVLDGLGRFSVHWAHESGWPRGVDNVHHGKAGLA
jgi:hypothetical protein